MKVKSDLSDVDTTGACLRFIRKKLGLTQSKMARRLGFKQALSVARYENGERAPGYSKLDIYATLGEVSMDWILRGPPPPAPYGRPEEIRKEMDEDGDTKRLQGRLEQLEKTFADYRREQNDRIERVLLGCEERLQKKGADHSLSHTHYQ